MERRFSECDRCGAPLPNVCYENIEIKITTKETGEETLKKVDLCNHCLNSFTRWFGKHNPFTGEDFYKYK